MADTYARDNATAHLQDICAWRDLNDALIDETTPEDPALVRYLKDELLFDGANWSECLDRLHQIVTEAPLCCEVRSGWNDITSTAKGLYPDEYRLTLSCGGPSLYVRGDLDDHAQPSSVQLIYADQSTPPTSYHPCWDSAEALLWFVSHFYWGS